MTHTSPTTKYSKIFRVALHAVYKVSVDQKAQYTCTVTFKLVSNNYIEECKKCALNLVK